MMQMGMSEFHAFPLFLINPFYYLKKISVIRLAKVGTWQKRHAELVHEKTMTEGTVSGCGLLRSRSSFKKLATGRIML